MRLTTLAAASLLAALAGCASTAPGPAPAPQAQHEPVAKNIIFFLGDGMGLNTLTAARIFAAGESGELTIDTLPESAFVKTFSSNAQVTDGAAAMSAYMTGVKQDNGVISMAAGTRAVAPGVDKNGNKLLNRCETGAPAPSLAELARQHGMAAGIVTNTSVTDATPAAVYAHICHRKAENDIAAAMVPGGRGFNAALGRGLDVVFGGGAQFFTPFEQGGKRSDGRDLLAELSARGYRVATTPAQLLALDATSAQPAVGLFAPHHMRYDAERDAAREPALPEMTRKAIDLLAHRPGGFLLVVEGGLIDHAQHDTLAKRALQETVSFDAALKAAIERMGQLDPGLKNTLIVATADHGGTLLLNGYPPRTGPTTAANPGVLGLVRNVPDGKLKLDKDGAPITIIGFGTGEHRRESRAGLALTDAMTAADDYHQEAAVRVKPGDETHGGADVYLGAIGANAELFRGTIDNTRVFSLIKQAAGW